MEEQSTTALPGGVGGLLREEATLSRVLMKVLPVREADLAENIKCAKAGRGNRFIVDPTRVQEFCALLF